ncbi:MAG: 16S rRNA (cytidine(1402)-2'-O)-methyltransferase [Erysipelotrichaceae bacterium]|nr:16S rRNA (cytidine(1402)-2'-O)-methyltransferase [Erysipelotrichaceae bacterium]
MISRELNFEGPSPILYLIATPIGNRGEMTPRALEVLSSCDFIAAEDTRNSGQLMAFFHIDKPFISCHEHNEEESSVKIIALLKQGKKVCFMSDAGYPCLSDPGQRLVANCLDNGIKVAVTSGPNAAINALACSGLDSTHFHFEGFLPAKESERIARLNELVTNPDTLIFYESPHRIFKTLLAMSATLGERKAVLARELTKAHEEFIRGTLPELCLLDEASLRGEMVLVVEGAKKTRVSLSDNEIALALKDQLEWGKTPKEAIKAVCQSNDLPKNRVYEIYLANFKRDE